MQGTIEATVTTLLAEVKTLMIGSRQVTLTVFAQLDRIADDVIIPFGRVSPPGNQEPVIWTIGKHKDNGTLVRSSLPLSNTGQRDYVTKAVGDQQYANMSWRTITNENVRERVEAHENRIKEVTRNLNEKIAQWQSLDLIVLAGLK